MTAFAGKSQLLGLNVPVRSRTAKPRNKHSLHLRLVEPWDPGRGRPEWVEGPSHHPGDSDLSEKNTLAQYDLK